jgi:hypothetical protein
MITFEQLLELPTSEAIYNLRGIISKMMVVDDSEVHYYQGVIERIIQRLVLLDQEKPLKENLKFCVDNYIFSQKTIDDLKTAIELANELPR